MSVSETGSATHRGLTSVSIFPAKVTSAGSPVPSELFDRKVTWCLLLLKIMTSLTPFGPAVIHGPKMVSAGPSQRMSSPVTICSVTGQTCCDSSIEMLMLSAKAGMAAANAAKASKVKVECFTVEYPRCGKTKNPAMYHAILLDPMHNVQIEYAEYRK